MAIRVIAFTTPIVTAFGASVVFAHLVRRPEPLAWRVVWCVAVVSASTVVLVGTDRLAKRVLPLAALLKLSLVFPDHVPSRFSVALRSGTTKQLVNRLRSDAIDPSTRAGATELLALVNALNHHDPLTRGHSERVRALSDLLAEQLHLDADEREKVRWAALLHDIGKLRVPSEILRKPGKPTSSEWEILKTHPAAGVHLVRGPIADWLGDWTRAIGEHHEWFDGTGYPAGLAGDEISLAGRLVAVADVFDVITAARSYKKAMTIQEALVELTRCAGTQFDPDLVRAFLQISIGDLRRAMGTLSWVAQLSWFGRLVTAPTATTLATGVAAITGLGVAPVIAGSTAMTHPATPSSYIGHVTAPQRLVESNGHVDSTIELTAPTTVATPPTIPAPRAGEAETPTASVTDAGTPSANVSATTTTVRVSRDATPVTAAPSTTPTVTTPPPTTPVTTVAPSVTLPATSVPTITVPAISVPVITVPPITTPPITVPPITVSTAPVGTLPVSTPPPLAPLVTVPNLKL